MLATSTTIVSLSTRMIEYGVKLPKGEENET